MTANLVFDTSSLSGFQTSLLFGYTGTTSVPEPASWRLFGSGLLGLGFMEMQRRRKQAGAAKQADQAGGATA
ncbi:MAG: PEP-CTERM sorting domain-containing protein [Stellaceae bacterium]